MLDVALAQIERDGMSVGLDHLRMEPIIAAAGISRATAYRRWPTRDDFIADVLVETVRRTSLIPEGPVEVDQLLQLVRERAGELITAQGRRDLVVEALRFAVDADIRRILASPRWLTFMSLSAAYPSLPAGRVADQVAAALVETDETFVARRTEIYANLAELIGYRLVRGVASEHEFRILGSASGAIMTGIIVRALAHPEWLDEREPMCLFGQSRTADWSEPERLVTGLLLSYLEPDPELDFTPAMISTMMDRFERFATTMWSESETD